MIALHTYYRSSAAYRVRIALELKALGWAAIPVHLMRNGGEQHAPAFSAINPAELVPVLQEDGLTLNQSLAIMEYLEERHPAPALLPPDPAGRARVRAMALAVACDIHPLNNSRVLQYLENTLGLDRERRQAWYAHWVGLGFAALEARLAAEPDTGRCCHGDSPTLADCCLVPQVYNAERFKVPLAPYPTLLRITAHCRELDAFRRAAPEVQGDAE